MLYQVVLSRSQEVVLETYITLSCVVIITNTPNQPATKKNKKITVDLLCKEFMYN